VYKGQIGCWALARGHPRWRWAIRFAFVPFALTILTTKQHYVVDLFGGLATATLGVWASGLLPTGLRPPSPPASPSPSPPPRR